MAEFADATNLNAFFKVLDCYKLALINQERAYKERVIACKFAIPGATKGKQLPIHARRIIILRLRKAQLQLFCMLFQSHFELEETFHCQPLVFCGKINK